ncbi:aromatic amino acid lyase [Thioclava indica]|uniref:Histidine ammonia-lyase n=1 Tax=Thioclava indica TaxID=1353528 RepID=A0A074K0L9_9RHOB|nr:aromatic amino acid lyase [Thioclava indica]KEO55102.1 hypothetical protein DT23_17970 [Thioclava indica]
MLKKNNEITLDGRSLTLGQLEALSNQNMRIARAAHTFDAVKSARSAVEVTMSSGTTAYGVTTSVGAFKDCKVTDEVELEFNQRLLRAHFFAIGEPIRPEIVRAAIAVRVNSALTGQAGVQPDLLDALINIYHADVIPEVRPLGSLGCADLGLMGQIGAALIGEGYAYYDGIRMPAKEALNKAGLKPYTPKSKEGLSLVSSNATSVASASLLLGKAFRLFYLSVAVLGASSAGFAASRQPWRSAAYHKDGLTPNLAQFALDSFAKDCWTDPKRVHDPLSFRCSMQVHGTMLETLVYTGQIARETINSSDDNPIVLDGELITSGHSLPQRLTLALETLLLNVAHLSRSSLNRVLALGKRELTGLSRNLTPRDGAVLAFGPPVKQAVDLFASIIDQSSPASLVNVTVADGMEDEETFLPLVTRKLEAQLDYWGKLLAHEAFVARQAVYLRGEEPLLKGLAGEVIACLSNELPPIDDDRLYSDDFIAAERLLTDMDWIEDMAAKYPFPTWEEGRT